MSKHYVGEIGTDILLDCGTDISDAVQQEIWYRKPGAVAMGSWTGALFSSHSTETGAAGTNFISYTLAAGDLDLPGDWRFQAYIATAVGTWWGDMIKETIYDKME